MLALKCLDGRVHFDEVVLHHALVAFLDFLSHPALEGHAHLGVEDVDHVLQSMIGPGYIQYESQQCLVPEVNSFVKKSSIKGARSRQE